MYFEGDELTVLKTIVKNNFDLGLNTFNFHLEDSFLYWLMDICSPNSLISSIHPKSFFDLFGNKPPQVGIQSIKLDWHNQQTSQE